MKSLVEVTQLVNQVCGVVEIEPELTYLSVSEMSKIQPVSPLRKLMLTPSSAGLGCWGCGWTSTR